MASSKPTAIRQTRHRSSPNFKARRLPMALVGVMAVASAFAGVFGTYLLKPIVNNYILPGDIPGLARGLLMMGLMYLAGVLCT